MRARGQKPEGLVVVGDSADSASWAACNRFFYVRARDIGEDLTAFAGLFVLVREYSAEKLHALAQQLALTAQMVTVHSTRFHVTDYYLA